MLTMSVQVDRAEWIALHGNDDGFDCYDMDDSNTMDMLDYRYLLACVIGITASALLSLLQVRC